MLNSRPAGVTSNKPAVCGFPLLFTHKPLSEEEGKEDKHHRC